MTNAVQVNQIKQFMTVIENFPFFHAELYGADEDDEPRFIRIELHDNGKSLVQMFTISEIVYYRGSVVNLAISVVERMQKMLTNELEEVG